MGPGRGGSAPARGESQEEAAAPPGASPGPGSFARQLCAAEQRLQLSLLPAEPPRGKGDLGLGGTGACPRMGMRGCGRPRRQRGAATLPCPQVGCRGCAPGRGGVLAFQLSAAGKPAQAARPSAHSPRTAPPQPPRSPVTFLRLPPPRARPPSASAQTPRRRREDAKGAGCPPRGFGALPPGREGGGGCLIPERLRGSGEARHRHGPEGARCGEPGTRDAGTPGHPDPLLQGCKAGACSQGISDSLQSWIFFC